MKAYRVEFDRKKYNRIDAMFIDVFARNAKDACRIVLDLFYNDKYHGTGFYPFHRRAYRIDENEMIRRLRYREVLGK